MFKKPYKVSTETILSSKDRKRTLQNFASQFDSTASQQLAEWASEVHVQKIEKSKVLVYKSGQNPIFVDLDSAHSFYPTVYALNRFPALAKHVLWVWSETAKFIANGANLMWKGVLNIEELGEFQAGDLGVVRTIEGRNVGVGTFPLGKSMLETFGKYEGVAVNIVHFEGDWLFQSGDQIVKHGPGIVFYQETPAEGKETGEQPKEPLPEQSESPVEVQPEAPVQMTPQQTDKLIIDAFLNAVKTSLTDDQLPIENSALWTHHMLLCTAENQLPDIKNSTFKKMGKLFTDLDEKGYIVYREASKKNPTPVIEKVNWSHPDIRDWTPTCYPKPVKKDKAEEPKVAKFQASTLVVNLYKPDEVVLSYFGDLVEKEFFTKAEVIEVMKGYLQSQKLLIKDRATLNDKLREDFKLVRAKDDNKQGKQRQKPKPAEGKPDVEKLMPEGDEDDDSGDSENEALSEKEAKPMAKTQPKNSQTAREDVIKQVSLKTLIDAVLKRCAPGYRTLDTRTGKEVMKKGRHFEVEVTIEKFQNKYLTKVLGLENYGFQLKKVLSDMQVHFATSGTIHERVLHKHTIEEISIQGAFNQEMVEYLEGQLGVDDNVIKVIDKAKLKRKKH